MKKLMRFLASIIVGAAGLALAGFVLVNLPVGEPRQDVHLGMTFSYRYAEALGLNWQETLLAQLDDLQIKQWRLPVYWDLVEATEGQPDYSTVDWQLDAIANHEGQVILSIGQRVPRWPECHIPGWAQGEDAAATTNREEKLLTHLQRTVEHYRGHEEIVMWQVENEPFLSQFGECPPLDPTFLEKEVALVKSLDTRPVLVTDSGELSLWVRAAKRGDVFGTTLYRHIYQRRFGYVTYPISPAFFQLKTLLVKTFTSQRNFMVIELQAEPWAPGWVANYPLEEQFKTMDERKLLENVQYAQRLGFPDIYLWGGEWWYYLKTQKDYPGLWDTARKLFQQYP
jgi:hypothetical protein